MWQPYQRDFRSHGTDLVSKNDDQRIALRKGARPNAKDSDDILIAVFGMTGAGKSSFISMLSGKEVEVGHNLRSCTTVIEEVPCKIGTQDVILVDTPGFDDTGRTDSEILTDIASWLKDSYDDKKRLTGVIYLHRISDNRMNRSSIRNLKLFRSLCGTNNLSHVVLASTMWDNLVLAKDQEVGRTREQELSEEYWKDLLADGAKMTRYRNNKQSAIALIEGLLTKCPITLKLQREVAIDKKQVIDTEAGKSLSEHLKTLEKKHEDDLAQVKQEMREAMRTNELKYMKELEAERMRIKEELDRTLQNQKKLHAPINKKSWWRWHWKCLECQAKLEVVEGYGRGTCPGCGIEQDFRP